MMFPFVMTVTMLLPVADTDLKLPAVLTVDMQSEQQCREAAVVVLKQTDAKTITSVTCKPKGRDT